MSPADVPGRVQAFVAAALVREGAEVEPAGEGRIFAVLPAPLPHELSLAEACVLVFHDEKADGEGAGGAGPSGQEPAGGSIPCPLEGSTVQALIDRARERGRRAATRLSINAGPAARRLEEARRRLSLLNATLADAQASIGIEATLVLEFSYEARSEERADGSIFVAVPAGGGVPSAASGAAL